MIIISFKKYYRKIIKNKISLKLNYIVYCFNNLVKQLIFNVIIDYKTFALHRVCNSIFNCKQSK